MNHSAPPSSLRPIFHPQQEHDQQRLNSPSGRAQDAKVKKPVVAPPMASMYEEEPERTQVTTINVLNSEEAPVYDDTWVTVFGFLTDRSVLAAVLQEFQLCGSISHWITPPAANCNWIYIQFETTQGAQRALKKSGQRLGMLPMMIGVQPLSASDRKYVTQQSHGSWTSKGMGSSLPERNYVLSSTSGKDTPVPLLLPKTWTQKLSEVVFGS